MPKLFIIDATSAIAEEQSFTESQRSPDMVIPMFAHRLAGMQKHWQPDQMVVAFDGNNIFRREFSPEYEPQTRFLHRFKVNPRRIDAAAQWCISQGIPMMQHVNYEAADIAATLLARDRDIKGVYASRSLVGRQLIESDRIAMLTRFPFIKSVGGRRPRWYTWPELVSDVFMLKFRPVPCNIIDFWCLAGLPPITRGATFIGSSKARWMLQHYGSLDAIAQAMPRPIICGSKANRREMDGLSDMFDNLAVLRNILTLRTDVPLPDIGLKTPDLGRFLNGADAFRKN